MNQTLNDASLDTFPKLMLSHARLRPDHDAIREKDLGIWQSWTWAQVAAEVRTLACGLASLGLERGDKLAIIGNNRPRLYWGMCAAQSLGAIPVPLYQDAVADEIAYVLDNADVKMALVEDQEQVDKILAVKDRCPRIEHIIFDQPRGLRDYPGREETGCEPRLRGRYLLGCHPARPNNALRRGLPAGRPWCGSDQLRHTGPGRVRHSNL